MAIHAYYRDVVAALIGCSCDRRPRPPLTKLLLGATREVDSHSHRSKDPRSLDQVFDALDLGITKNFVVHTGGVYDALKSTVVRKILHVQTAIGGIIRGPIPPGDLRIKSQSTLLSKACLFAMR